MLVIIFVVWDLEAVSYFPSLGGDGLVSLRNYKLTNLRCYRVFGLLPRSAWFICTLNFLQVF